MQSLLGSLDPALKPVPIPAHRFDQDHPAACTNRTRRWRLPRFDILPRMVRSPVEICLGTRPNHAAKSRPLAKASPVPIAATIALEMIGPMPGTLVSRSHPASCRAKTAISLDKSSIRSSRRRQSSAKSLMIRAMRADSASGGVAKMRGNSARNNRSPCRMATPQGANLIDDASALADQSLSYTMQGLQVELFGGLRCHKLHGWPLDCFCDRFRIAEVVLLSL